MPSKKQRRKRQKERRHEYEYVYVDEEGHEVEPPPEEVETGRNGKKNAPAVARGRAPQKRPAKGAARQVPPPSWKRALKRGGIFAPFMLVTLYLLSGKKSGWGPVIIQTAYLLVLFVPFSYLVDRAMHRRYLRQTGQLPPARQSGRQS
jgi:hypothetical protein